MPEQDSFPEFVRRLRAGDEQAAVELVRTYESIIRREVRLHLTDPALYAAVESADVCQSVLASFFVRVAAGKFDLERPQQLAGLLMAMARKKVAFRARKARAARRDVGRLVGYPVEDLNPAASGPSPSEVVAGRDLLEAFRQRLSDEERQLFDLQAQGLAWAEIAARVGGTPDGRRMQLGRATDRVVRELGLAEEDDE
jgi:RNA polymerase sigma-70 factor (ECF subfamily)